MNNFNRTHASGNLFYQLLVVGLIWAIASLFISCSATNPDQIELQPGEVMVIATIGQPIKVPGTDYYHGRIYEVQMIAKASPDVPDVPEVTETTPLNIIVVEQDLEDYNSAYLQRLEVVLKYEPDQGREPWVWQRYQEQ